MTRREIEAAIADISEKLKKSGIPYQLRLMMHMDRKELRAKLAEMIGADT